MMQARSVEARCAVLPREWEQSFSLPAGASCAYVPAQAGLIHTRLLFSYSNQFVQALVLNFPYAQPANEPDMTYVVFQHNQHKQ